MKKSKKIRNKKINITSKKLEMDLIIKDAHHLLSEAWLLLSEHKLNRKNHSKLIYTNMGVIKSGIFNQLTELEYDELDKAFKNERKLKKEKVTTEERFKKVMAGLSVYSLPHVTEKMPGKPGINYTVFIRPGHTQRDFENSKNFMKSILSSNTEEKINKLDKTLTTKTNDIGTKS